MEPLAPVRATEGREAWADTVMSEGEAIREAVFLLTNYPQLWEENRLQKDEILYASNRREAFVQVVKHGQTLSDPTASKAVRMAELPWEQKIALVRDFFERLPIEERKLVVLIWRHGTCSNSWRQIRKNFGECTDCQQLWREILKKFANYLNRYAGTAETPPGDACAVGRKSRLEE